MSLVISWFRDGGVMMWPILGAAVLVLGAALDEGWKVRRASPQAEINVVLVWGVLAAVFGLLGALVGLAQAAGSIVRAGAVEPTLVWGGLQILLSKMIFGLCVFALSLLLWFVLRAVKARAQGPAPAPTA